MAALLTSCAEEMNPSRRNTMEDCHVTHSPGTWACNDAEMTYLAVCDGHGGRDIVEFLEHTLAENIAQELNEDDDASIHTRLERAFLITDIQSHMMAIDTSGATVALCLVKKQPRKRIVTIHAANAGDARVVLSCTPVQVSQQQSPTKIVQHNRVRSKEKTAYRLTYDHRADDPIEQSRIEKMGGFVARNRVLGVLAVARSLGDHGMKEFVIGRPFINTVEVDLGDSLGGPSLSLSSVIRMREKEEKFEGANIIDGRITSDQFVIVGCDGLWDVVEDQNAVDLVRAFVHEDGDKAVGNGRKEDAAQMLCDEALRRGSTDNVTVVVSWL